MSAVENTPLRLNYLEGAYSTECCWLEWCHHHLKSWRAGTAWRSLELVREGRHVTWWIPNEHQCFHVLPCGLFHNSIWIGWQVNFVFIKCLMHSSLVSMSLVCACFQKVLAHSLKHRWCSVSIYLDEWLSRKGAVCLCVCCWGPSSSKLGDLVGGKQSLVSQVSFSVGIFITEFRNVTELLH
jgi:hypothetical protein